MKILVTGASGFVGRALCAALTQAGHECLPAVRCAKGMAAERVVGPIGADTDWRAALDGAEAVVHLAARVHVMKDSAENPLADFRAVNVLGTERLARSAAAASVRRLVFLSSVKVNGEATPGAPFRESDAPAPEDAYGVSKHEAEQALHRVAVETGLEVAILRPPLVYGPGVGANFLRLMGLAAKAWPLPLASLDNRRSLLFVGNLCSAIIACLTHPAAGGQTFLVSDGEDISTPELVRRLAGSLGAADRLWPLPLALLRALGSLVGRSAEIARLTESLRMDSSAIRDRLGWHAPFTLDQGLTETAAWFRASRADVPTVGAVTSAHD
ncbi:MAG: NAD-dependent epimerase/dehydratase family protein [Rhodocyclaceae bacterium]|nr:NAD-dependent epimerase/dehydratase family protein [Rhodocyclaceae bacterium]